MGAAGYGRLSRAAGFPPACFFLLSSVCLAPHPFESTSQPHVLVRQALMSMHSKDTATWLAVGVSPHRTLPSAHPHCMPPTQPAYAMLPPAHYIYIYASARYTVPYLVDRN